MTKQHECANGKTLLFTDRGRAVLDLNGLDTTPCVVLISAWSADSVSSADKLVELLVDRGCKYFVCTGTYAEGLHDFVDDVIGDRLGASSTVATTYHDDESADEIVDFFVRVAEPADKCIGGLVAILDERFRQDDEIRALLLRS